MAKQAVAAKQAAVAAEQAAVAAKQAAVAAKHPPAHAQEELLHVAARIRELGSIPVGWGRGYRIFQLSADFHESTDSDTVLVAIFFHSLAVIEVK